eukprot:2202148-Lingulodinium_polyedra.AAC.1
MSPGRGTQYSPRCTSRCATSPTGQTTPIIWRCLAGSAVWRMHLGQMLHQEPRRLCDTFAPIPSRLAKRTFLVSLA